MTFTTNEKDPLLPAPEVEEPSLASLQADVRAAQRAYLAAWSRTTSGKWHRRIMYTVTAFLLFLFIGMFGLIMIIDEDDPAYYGKPARVPLTAHIMSKCPDARDCLHDLILPAMIKVGDRVDFRLEYIGNVTEDGSVACKHGDDECLGNIIELCAQKEYPDPRIYLGFTMCLTRDYQMIPQRQLVDNCALEHGIDMEKLNRCSTDKDGYLSVDELKKSFNRTKAAGVTKSCTVMLNDEIRCVRDDGQWKECDGGHEVKNLVRDVIDLTESIRYEF